MKCMDLLELHGMLYRYFRDIGKVNLWLSAKNPQLGNVSPRQMIAFGNLKRLNQFVYNAIKQNIPENQMEEDLVSSNFRGNYERR